jgi:putative flippase GtrA
MRQRAVIGRFLVVGITAVLIDFGAYRGLLALGVDIDVSKAVGFVAGAVFGYVVNRDWTFQAAGGPGVIIRFIALYAASLLLNVGVNAAVLAILPAGELARAVAFLIATGASATSNFCGMKWLVFTRSAQGGSR